MSGEALTATVQKEMKEMLGRFSTELVFHALQHADPGGVEREIEAIGYTNEEHLEISDEDQAMIDAAEKDLALFAEAENLMRAGRRDDARHLLYTRLPRGMRDIFHPEQGLKA